MSDIIFSGMGNLGIILLPIMVYHAMQAFGAGEAHCAADRRGGGVIKSITTHVSRITKFDHISNVVQLVRDTHIVILDTSFEAKLYRHNPKKYSFMGYRNNR